MRILYVAGSRNCGSTLLDAILGHAPGARSLGEAGGFHRYPSAPWCDCGEAPASCAPCRAVLKTLDADGDLDNLQRVGPLPLKERRLYWLIAGTGGRAEYARIADLVFDAASAATASDVLIDSSKNVSRAAALVYDSRHDVRVVHLVRDGRGYIQSRQRRAGATGAHHSSGRALAGWAAKNLAISALGARLGPDRYLLVRYEDLVRDPAGVLDRIGNFAGLDTTGLAARVTGMGVERRHLFEPARRADYRTVRLDPARLESQRLPPADSARFWARGGLLSAVWGYDRSQSYLQPPEG